MHIFSGSLQTYNLSQLHSLNPRLPSKSIIQRFVDCPLYSSSYFPPPPPFILSHIHSLPSSHIDKPQNTLFLRTVSLSFLISSSSIQKTPIPLHRCFFCSYCWTITAYNFYKSRPTSPPKKFQIAAPIHFIRTMTTMIMTMIMMMILMGDMIQCRCYIRDRKLPLFLQQFALDCNFILYSTTLIFNS